MGGRNAILTWEAYYGVKAPQEARFLIAKRGSLIYFKQHNIGIKMAHFRKIFHTWGIM